MRRSGLYQQLCALARREGRDAASAEDIVQEALLVAVAAGRADLADPATGRWLSGVVRNKARMFARTGLRRRRREGLAAEMAPAAIATPADASAAEILTGLPPALRAVAALALSGHSRAEIGWLLRLSDTALRQRISTLGRRLRARRLGEPAGLPGLATGLAYGRIRQGLGGLLRRGALFATHDPDGHILVVSRSQKGEDRQQAVHHPNGEL